MERQLNSLGQLSEAFGSENLFEKFLEWCLRGYLFPFFTAAKLLEPRKVMGRQFNGLGQFSTLA